MVEPERHNALKPRREKRAGSSPATRTIKHRQQSQTKKYYSLLKMCLETKD